jgi:drug/metabolite transporter (DMT)-like permease
MLSILLALAASVSWGVSDFLGGLTSRRLSVLSVLLLSQSVGLVMVVPAVLASGQAPVDGPARLSAIGGSVAGLIGIAALYRAIAVGVASIAAPISATGAAIPVAVGVLRGEPTSVWQEIGIALAIAGVVLAAGAADGSAATSRAQRLTSAGTGSALIAAAGFGSFFVLLHDASTYSVVWATFVQRVTSVGILLVATLVLRPSLAVGWRRTPRLLAIGALDQGANLLYGFASTVGLVSLAAVLASLFPIITVVLARAILHERISRTQQTGVACALAGVALIAGG